MATLIACDNGDTTECLGDGAPGAGTEPQPSDKKGLEEELALQTNIQTSTPGNNQTSTPETGGPQDTITDGENIGPKGKKKYLPSNWEWYKNEQKKSQDRFAQ